MSDTTADLDNTLGVLYICTMLAMGLWGAACVQVYYYYKRYPKDSLGIKLFVAVVIIGDTAHQAMIMHASYVYQINNFGDVLFINNIVTTIMQMVLVNAFVSAAVQVFLVRRVWFLSGKCKSLVIILLLLVSVEFLLTIVFYGEGVSIKAFPDLERIYSLTRTMNAFSAVTSSALTGCLIFLLNRCRTGIEDTETLIDRLIVFMLSTGLLTTMVAVSCLITITLLPASRIYVGLYYLITKLYTNSLLASLNARGCSNIVEHRGNNSSCGSHESAESQLRVMKVNPSGGRTSTNIQLVSIDLNV